METPCWSLLSVWVSSYIRSLLNQKEPVRSICSNEDQKLLSISKSADYFRRSVFFSLVLKMQPLPVVVGYCFLPELWVFLRELQWVRWPSMAFLPLVTWDGTLRNSSSWYCQGSDLVHSSTGVAWTLLPVVCYSLELFKFTLLKVDGLDLGLSVT